MIEKEAKVKSTTWLKIGLILLLPSPVIGAVVVAWGAYKLIKNRTSEEENTKDK